MNKYGLLLLFSFLNCYAEDTNEKNTDLDVNNKQQDKNEIKNEPLPDKELLLFLSEFTDAEGQWVDPEIFNQTEITNSNVELEEVQNEDHPNNI